VREGIDKVDALEIVAAATLGLASLVDQAEALGSVWMMATVGDE